MPRLALEECRREPGHADCTLMGPRRALQFLPLRLMPFHHLLGLLLMSLLHLLLARLIDILSRQLLVFLVLL